MEQNNRPTGLSRKEVVSYYTNPKNCDSKNGCLTPKKSIVNAFDKDGYPLIKWEGKTRRLARLVLKDKVGDKAVEGKVTMHSCNNHGCIKPSHLSPGTPKENSNDQNKIIGEEMAQNNKKTFRWVGEINSSPFYGISASNAEEVFNYLDEDESNEAYISISSPGGSVNEAQTIIERLSPYKSRIKVEAIGIIASAASHISMTIADKLYARGQTRIMIHRASAGIEGNAEDFEKVKERLDQVDSILVDSINKKSGLSKKQIREYLERETFFTSKQALELKLIDEILEPNEKFTEAKIDESIKAFMSEKNIQTKVNNKETDSMSVQVLKEDGSLVEPKAEETKTEETVEEQPVQEKVVVKGEWEEVARLTSENSVLREKEENWKIEKESLLQRIKHFEKKDKERSEQINKETIQNALKRGAITPKQEEYWIERFKNAYDEKSALEIRAILNGLDSSELYQSVGKAFAPSDINYYNSEEVARLKERGATDKEVVSILSARHKENK